MIRAVRSFLFLLSALLLLPTPGSAAPGDIRPEAITVPPGFAVSLYSEAVPGARSMALGSNGTVFVGTRDQGLVYALVDSNRDGRADAVYIIIAGLSMPNGVAFRDGSLYVATVNLVLRFDNIEEHLGAPRRPKIISDDFPSERGHGWKYLRFGPDGYLYVPVGAPCNICETEDPYAALHRMRPDGSGKEIFARGIRNTVGFDWHPRTGELWFTDNGRDWLGDDLPPDELNRAPEKGLHFGYPYVHGRDLRDPDFGGKAPPDRAFTPPAKELGAHVAPLGISFYTGTMFPETYRNRLFVAEHGSWNRTQAVGYRVMTATLSENEVTAYEVFAEGWLQETGAWGRPVDVLQMEDGSLLVSDDRAGAIYRITYQGGEENSGASSAVQQ